MHTFIYVCVLPPGFARHGRRPQGCRVGALRQGSNGIRHGKPGVLACENNGFYGKNMGISKRCTHENWMIWTKYLECCQEDFLFLRLWHERCGIHLTSWFNHQHWDFCHQDSAMKNGTILGDALGNTMGIINESFPLKTKTPWGVPVTRSPKWWGTQWNISNYQWFHRKECYFYDMK